MQSPRFPNFFRFRRATPANPSALPHLAAPYRQLTFRQWEASVMLVGLSGEARDRLWTWLTATQRPYDWAYAPLERNRPAFDAATLRDGTATTFREKLWKELLAMQQTLNTPLPLPSGPTRDKLLMQHGIRLRQLLEALPKQSGGLPAAQEIALMLRWL